MSLLVNDWGYPVDSAELQSRTTRSSTPVASTCSRWHRVVPHAARHADGRLSTRTSPLPTARSTRQAPYEIPVDGRYWAEFDRRNPIDAAVRTQAWTGTAHALIGELGVGSATASTLQMGLGLAGLFAGIGFAFIFAGLGLAWAARPETAKVPVLRPALQPA